MLRQSWLWLLCVVAQGCSGPAPVCGPTNCTGCCDASGACRAGDAFDSCGAAGVTCASCATGQVCKALACVPDSYANIDAFVADYIPALCARAVRCSDASTQAGCEDVARFRWSQAAKIAQSNADAQAAGKDGRVTFDGVKAKRCLDALRTGVCTETLDQNEDCKGAFTGTVADNQTCYVDFECNIASYCTSTGGTCPGQCQPRKAGGVTATTGRDRECQAGLYIYAGRCLALATLNGSCAPVTPATARQTCIQTAFCGTGNVCLARGAVAATCTADEQCQESLVCNNGTCATPAALNGTCNRSPRIACQIDLQCDLPTAGSPGTCQVLAAVTAPCRATNDCRTDSYCEGAVPPARGTCAARKPFDGTCTTNEQCQSGLYCTALVSGRCATQLTNGQSCVLVANEPCVAGYSCRSGTCRPDACHDPTP